MQQCRLTGFIMQYMLVILAAEILQLKAELKARQLMIALSANYCYAYGVNNGRLICKYAIK